MKTRDSKLQKTKLTSLANLIVLIAAVMFLSSKAVATEKKSSLNTGAETFTEMLASERDAEMNLENWMLNKNNFYHSFELEAANEAALKLESWMTDADMFTAGYDLAAESEGTLNLAEWMKNESNFMPDFFYELEMEKALELESWMTVTENFIFAYSMNNEAEGVLNIEEWMLNNNVFYSIPDLETEIEKTLKLEKWMVIDTTFNSISNEKTTEETLAMTSTGPAKRLTTIEYKDADSGLTFIFILADTEEPELQLENWMVNKRYWDRKLKTE